MVCHICWPKSRSRQLIPTTKLIQEKITKPIHDFQLLLGGRWGQNFVELTTQNVSLDFFACWLYPIPALKKWIVIFQPFILISPFGIYINLSSIVLSFKIFTILSSFQCTFYMWGLFIMKSTSYIIKYVTKGWLIIFYIYAGWENTLGYKLHWYLKFNNHVILFLGSKTLCTFNKLWLVISKLVLVVSKRFNQ